MSAHGVLTLPLRVLRWNPIIRVPRIGRAWKKPGVFLALNGMLGCVAVAELIAGWVLVTTPAPLLSETLTPMVRSSTSSSVPVPSSVEPAASIAAAASRPLFRTAGHPVAPSTPSQTEQGKAMVERLQVAGVVTGSPSQAILEDPKTHQTHVVRAGQHMGDGVVVEAILPHGVVLSVGGESYERPW